LKLGVYIPTTNYSNFEYSQHQRLLVDERCYGPITLVSVVEKHCADFVDISTTRDEIPSIFLVYIPLIYRYKI
jgi:hypothetical protein